MWSDEECQEWDIWYRNGNVLDREQQRLLDTMQIEAIEQAERDEEYRQANCPHENVTMEMSPKVYRNGAVELIQVCEDCGLESHTGTYTSVL